jgi:hypothetical protein
MAATERITIRELDRFKVIQDVRDGKLTPWRAAERLGLTSRQIRRLVERLRMHGPEGLVLRQRSKPTTDCGFFQCSSLGSSCSGKGLSQIRANRLKSRCFGARDGETPVTTRNSNEIDCRAVRAICLAASEQGRSRPREETELSPDFQLLFAFALPGPPVEGAANRKRFAEPPGDQLHAHLSSLSTVASERLF